MADLRSLMWSLVLGAGAVFVTLGLYHLVFSIVRRATRAKVHPLFRRWMQYGNASARLILPILALLAVTPWLRLSPALHSAVGHTLALVLIAAIGWRLIAVLDALQDSIVGRHPAHTTDNLASRRLRTQVQVLRRIAGVVVAVATIAIMLMTFPNIRHLGESLFASASLAALVGGLAARTMLSNLLAGVQIALTQPIRLEDVVIVEGEWGWVEEITTTYVVVRVWDLRRLVLPLSYFIEKPFQNWTRQSTNLLGTVFLYVDYSVPVDRIREELHHILRSSEMWDGQTWGLHVTNTTERTVELRALMSAPSSSACWNLRCHVREKLVEFLQRHYPQCLPLARADVLYRSAQDGSEATRQELHEDARSD